MSVQGEINRINENVSNSYTALNGLGATAPTVQNTNNLASTINSIKAVQYAPQTLSQEQKKQARENIGAMKKGDSLPANGGNADTVGGLTFVTSAAPPVAGTPDTTITFVV